MLADHDLKLKFEANILIPFQKVNINLILKIINQQIALWQKELDELLTVD
ncbi:MAG: hypothetical protein QW165_01595 [Candidatus Woesearchaeota archaeon]